jgi:simple sugar transport system substrate-binding protein
MFSSGTRALAAALVAGLALAATGCSSTGGRQAQEGGGAAGLGRANTPPMKVAMITHAAPGDTFWDIIRKGAETAAAKDNAQLTYSSDVDGGRQATLVQNAIDSRVDGIAVTLAKPEALAGVLEKAQAAGIPVVAFNSGLDNWQQAGALQYFGSDETLAGEEAGKRIGQDGGTKALCVVQEQGHVALEARCAGVKRGFTGGTTENLYVQGTNMPAVRSTIEAKLKQDPSINYVVTLGGPFALTAIEAAKAAGSPAKIATFDTNRQIPAVIKSGALQWAIDQQPYLQGYLAVDSLWLYKTNGNVLGGGQTVATGPYFIDKTNVEAVEKFAAQGTR